MTSGGLKAGSPGRLKGGLAGSGGLKLSGGFAGSGGLNASGIFFPRSFGGSARARAVERLGGSTVSTFTWKKTEVDIFGGVAFLLGLGVFFSEKKGVI